MRSADDDLANLAAEMSLADTPFVSMRRTALSSLVTYTQLLRAGIRDIIRQDGGEMSEVTRAKFENLLGDK